MIKLTDEMIAGAQDTEKKYGVPASVTLAQMIQESSGSYSGGMSGLAFKYNNLFGVTAGSSWTGNTVTMSNKSGTDTKTYRVYNSINDSINDHGKLLTNERYTKFTKNAKSVEDYVNGVAAGGYAEDPNYAKSLIKLINEHKLNQYNTGDWITGSSNKNGNIGNNGTDSSSTDSDKKSEYTAPTLRWYGDLLVMVITVLVVVLGIIFFIQAFNLKNPIKSIKSKIGGG